MLPRMIARDTDVNYSRGGLTWIALVCLIIARWITDARCDDQIRRLPDGRYLVQVKDVTVALPEEPEEQADRLLCSDAARH